MSEILVTIRERTVQQLQALASAQGISIEQEASYLLDGAVKRTERMRAFIAETDAFAASLPQQITDSAALVREDRDNR